jgi:hypothetical protein
MNERLDLGDAAPLPTRPHGWDPQPGDIVWYTLTVEEAQDVYVVYGEHKTRVLVEITELQHHGIILVTHTLHDPVMHFTRNLARFGPAPPLIALAAQA